MSLSHDALSSQKRSADKLSDLTKNEFSSDSMTAKPVWRTMTGSTRLNDKVGLGVKTIPLEL